MRERRMLRRSAVVSVVVNGECKSGVAVIVGNGDSSRMRPGSDADADADADVYGLMRVGSHSTAPRIGGASPLTSQ